VRNRLGDGTEVRVFMREVAVAVNRQRGALNTRNVVVLNLKHALNQTCQAEAASGLQRLLRMRNEFPLVFAASGQSAIEPARRKILGLDGSHGLSEIGDAQQTGNVAVSPLAHAGKGRGLRQYQMGNAVRIPLGQIHGKEAVHASKGEGRFRDGQRVEQLNDDVRGFGNAKSVAAGREGKAGSGHVEADDSEVLGETSDQDIEMLDDARAIRRQHKRRLVAAGVQYAQRRGFGLDIAQV